ncbi:MAG: dihydrolipoamide acetyltransferase family protein [Hyphomonadaceae bacterium]
MTEFLMPSLGADMEDATLIEWLAKPGDNMKRGDVIAVVETQKGAIEVEVFEDGVLEEHVVAPGAVLPVGAVMARYRGASEVVAPRPVAPASAPAPAAPKPPPAPEASSPARPPPAPGPRASPAARRLAEQLGIDLTAVVGSGPGGGVTREDVATRARAPAEKRAAGFDVSAMRRAIAAAMGRSKREIPHYYLSNTVDIGAAQDWLAAANAQLQPAERLLMGALYIKAVAKAAREFPEFNGFHVEDEFRPSEAIHVGVAIAIRGGGLAAPAIHDTADLALAELMAKLRDLVARVRAARFRSSEIADPTITVTSLGDRGVDAVWGVIYPPQVAIVGFGRIVMRPWATGSQLAARPTVCVTLAADHRVSDGHNGALFLERISQLLAKPDEL